MDESIDRSWPLLFIFAFISRNIQTRLKAADVEGCADREFCGEIHLPRQENIDAMNAAIEANTQPDAHMVRFGSIGILRWALQKQNITLAFAWAFCCSKR